MLQFAPADCERVLDELGSLPLISLSVSTIRYTTPPSSTIYNSILKNKKALFSKEGMALGFEQIPGCQDVVTYSLKFQYPAISWHLPFLRSYEPDACLQTTVL